MPPGGSPGVANRGSWMKLPRPGSPSSMQDQVGVETVLSETARSPSSSVELLAVLLIMGMLAAVAFPNYLAVVNIVKLLAGW